MIFLSAQPDDFYFVWQLQLQISNLNSLGIPKEQIHILIGFNKKKGEQSHIKQFIKANKKLANIFTYADERISRIYPSSIRPHLISQHFLKFPYLENESIFYHDSDIIFRELPEFENLISKGIWFASNVKSYIGFEYLYKIGGNELIEGMSSILEIDPSLVKTNDNHVGGAQYLLNDLSCEFWNNIEKKSEQLYIFLEGYNSNQAEKLMSSQDSIQSWCADMWVLLWSAWRQNKKVETSPELDFCWPHQPIDRWHRCKILHYSGVYPFEDKTVFKKTNYLHYSPIYDDNLTHIHAESCSAPLRDLIFKNRKRLESKRYNLLDLTIIIDLSKYGNLNNHNVDVIIRYITNKAKTNIIVIARHIIPRSLKKIKRVHWINKENNKRLKETLVKAIKTEHLCLYPPLLISFSSLKNILVERRQNSSFTCFFENILYVDPFFQEIVDKLRDENVLRLHHSKFLSIPPSDHRLYYSSKDIILNILLNETSPRICDFNNNFSLTHGYRFIKSLNCNKKESNSGDNSEPSEDDVSKIDPSLVQAKTDKPFPITGESICWLESDIAKIWIKLEHGTDKIGHDNLDHVLNNLHEINDITFSKGLIGIGFGIEVLAQKQFIDSDSNILLEDFDDLFYRSYLFNHRYDITLQSGMAGKLLYLIFRNRNLNKNTHRYKSMIHHECIQILLDQITDYLPLPIQGLKKFSKTDMCQLILLFSSIITRERIKFRTLKKIIEIYSRHFLDIFKQETDISVETGCCCFLLLQTNRRINNLYFKHSFNKFFKDFADNLASRGEYSINLLTLTKEETVRYLVNEYENEFKNLTMEIKNAILLKLLCDDWEVN